MVNKKMAKKILRKVGINGGEPFILNLRTSKRMVDELDRIAKKHKASRSALLKEVIEEFLLNAK